MTADVADAERFGAALAEHARSRFFDREAPVVVARAPGRLDLMGGIADYSGSLVLQLPLAAATLVAAQRIPEREIILRSLAAQELGADPEITIALDRIAPNGVPIDDDAAHSMLAAEPRRRWAAYVAGAFVVLARERGLPIDRGLRLLIDSTVPAGKGVASSAALEVAAMQALRALYDIPLDGRELALLCQRVENVVVGAPCGVMDQMTAACGEADRLLALLCQPADVVGQVPLPEGLEVWGIDSGIRHEVGGADYTDVRIGAFMGYRMIADLAGLPAHRDANGLVHVDDHRWNGYLANVTPAEWESRYRDAIPLAMTGTEFLERFGGITDRVTRVDPSRSYSVRQPSAHPIYEHERVGSFRALLEAGATNEDQRLELGELMYRSHVSYGACGLGSSGTDRLVELVREAGAGIYGAKITGGGSGGVVAVLARAGSQRVVDGIARRYMDETGRTAMVLGGSSAGAITSGILRVSS
jgi:L-arabinokinase